MIWGLDLGLGLNLTRRGGSWGAAAYAALAGLANGFVLDPIDDVVLVRDAGTPANNFCGSMAQALAAGILVNASPPTKMLFNSSGILTSGSNLRCQYSATGTPLGFLPEPQRVNLLQQSEALATSPWAISGSSSIENNAAVAPDGTMTASLLTATATESSGRYQNVTVAASTSYAYSHWIKLGTLPLSEYRIAFYNVTAGSWITLNAAYTGTPTASGWTRIHYVVTTPAGCTSLRVYPHRTPAGASSGGTVYLWGAQLETGLFPTSYTKTEASAVTRGPDDLYVDLSKVPALGSEFTVIGEAEPCPDTSSTSHILFSVFNSSTEALVLRNYTAGVGGLQFVNTTGGVSTGVINVNSAVAASRFKFAAACKTDNFEIVTDGVSRGTDTSGALMTGATGLYVGKNGPGGFGQHWAAPVGFVALIPERLSQADMITRTS